MPSYYVNKNAQPNGDHEVHEIGSDCGHEPNPENRISLGAHDSCVGAVQAARGRFGKVNGCYYCCELCHTS